MPFAHMGSGIQMYPNIKWGNASGQAVLDEYKIKYVLGAAAFSPGLWRCHTWPICSFYQSKEGGVLWYVSIALRIKITNLNDLRNLLVLILTGNSLAHFLHNRSSISSIDERAA